MSGIVGINTNRKSGQIATVTVDSGIETGSSDPTVSTNPSGAGVIFANTTSGEMYICNDATAGANVWKNVGPGSGDIS